MREDIPCHAREGWYVRFLFKGDIMTTIQKAILIAIVKGVTHATVMPVTVFFLVNHFFTGNWGGVASIGYIVIVGWFYNKVLKNKDISKIAFNVSALALMIAPVAFKTLQALAWGLG